MLRASDCLERCTALVGCRISKISNLPGIHVTPSPWNPNSPFNFPPNVSIIRCRRQDSPDPDRDDVDAINLKQDVRCRLPRDPRALNNQRQRIIPRAVGILPDMVSVDGELVGTEELKLGPEGAAGNFGDEAAVVQRDDAKAAVVIGARAPRQDARC